MSNINISDELRKKITDEIREKIKEQYGDEIRENIKKQLESGITEEVKASVKEEIKGKLEGSDIKQGISDVVAEDATEDRPVEDVAEDKDSEEKVVADATEEKPVEVTTEEKAAEIPAEDKPVEVATEVTSEDKPAEIASEDKPVEAKKGFTFKKGLLIYAGVWLVITLIASLVLWNKMAGYQHNYDAAKAAANPDLQADVIIESFAKEKIRETGADVFAEVSSYESNANWDAFLTDIYGDGTVSYNRVEKFSETNPQYEVYAGNNLIGTFKLTESGDADKYGFHGYELKSLEVLIELPELTDCTVIALNGDSVTVNGKAVSEDAVIDSVSDSVHDVAAAKAGKGFEKASYKLSGFLAIPEVRICEQTVEPDDDNVFEKYIASDETFISNMSDRVYGASETYIKVMNMMTGFNNLTGYLVANGNAYKAIQSAMSGLSWAGAPEEFSIKNSEITEMWKYDDSTFVVVTHHEIHRIYRGETYDEEMTIESMFINYQGNWYIQEMALKR